MREEKDKKTCGNCKHHRRSTESKDDWLCTNPDSDYVADYTEYGDWCHEWEGWEGEE